MAAAIAASIVLFELIWPNFDWIESIYVMSDSMLCTRTSCAPAVPGRIRCVLAGTTTHLEVTQDKRPRPSLAIEKQCHRRSSK
jgi:hypothetical protein